MPQQLWDTTMDPERRFLKRISVDDAAETDRMFRVLMGDQVSLCKSMSNVLGCGSVVAFDDSLSPTCCQVGPRKELILNECENLERDDLDI